MEDSSRGSSVNLAWRTQSGTVQSKDGRLEIDQLENVFCR